MAFLSITAIERGATTLAKKLAKQYGLTVEMTVLRSGHGGDYLYSSSGSYVELEVSAEFVDRDGDPAEAWAEVKFTTSETGRHSISCQNHPGWRSMAEEGTRRILSQLATRGWTPPEKP